MILGILGIMMVIVDYSGLCDEARSELGPVLGQVERLLWPNKLIWRIGRNKRFKPEYDSPIGNHPNVH